MDVLDDNEFKCAKCGNVYEKGMTEEECEAEYRENFPEVSIDEPKEVICDDCYGEFMEWLNKIRSR